MITKDFVVKIKKDETKLNGMPYVYQGDRGIVFEMTLDNWKYFFSQATGIEEDQLVDCQARILIFNPNEEQIKLADAPIKNNEVNFIINQNLTEVAGNYTVYIQIFKPDGATVTCPPFIFTVKELKSFEKVLPSDRGTIKIQDQYVLSYDSTEECGAKFISELPKITTETDENYLIIQVDGITNIISVADFLKDTKAELKKYTDDKDTRMKSYVDTNFQRIDENVNSKEAELKQYSDNNLQTAKKYTDDELLAKSTEINKRIDNISSDMNKADTILDEKINTKEAELKQYSDTNLQTGKDYTDTKTTEAKSYADTKVSELVGSAPETLDTIHEIATALKGDANIVDTLTTEIGKKADKVHTHTKSEITDLFTVENDFTSNSTENAISVSKAKETDDKVNTLRNEYNATKDVVDNKLDELSISTENELVANANGVEKYRLPLPKGFDGKYTSLTDVPKEFVPSKHTHKVADIEDMFIVEDNLTSTSTVNALSAAKGKELQDKLDKIDMSGNHSHDNKPELDLIKTGDVAKWNKITTKYDDFEIIGGEIIFKIDGTEVKRGTLPHGFSGVYTDLTDIPTEFNPSKHTHVKADITDLNIIDNLITADTDNPLSANQGKLIKDELDIINGKINDVHTHNNKAELDKITDGKVAEWDAKETTTGSQEKATQAENNAKGYTDAKISDLVGTAPDTLDTIQEIATALSDNKDTVGILTTQISSKADKKHIHLASEITTDDNAQFVSSTEKTNWNNKADKEHNHVMADITDLFKVENDLMSNSTTNAVSVSQVKVINDKVVGLEENVDIWNSKADGTHTHNLDDLTEGVTNKFVTQEEKDKWNNSTDISDETISKTSTWSSEKIQGEITKIGSTRKAEYKIINISTWELDEVTGLQKATVIHNMNTTNLMISAFNHESKSNEIISYKIVDANTIEIMSEDTESIDLQIFGGIVDLIEKESEINDSLQGMNTTWSSEKIANIISEKTLEINKLKTLASQTGNGLMSSTDKKKLDGIDVSNIVSTADKITYTDDVTQLGATDVQGAIVKLTEQINALNTEITGLTNRLNVANTELENEIGTV